MAQGSLTNLSGIFKGLMNLPLTRQLVLLGILAVSIGLGYSVVSWLYQTNYRPLYSNLDNKDLAAIADILQKSNIDFKVSDRDGSILVPVNKTNEARIKLMGAGFGGDSSNFGFADLDKESGIGTSRFLENIRYVRALEGEMARTIMAIQGIKAARVHLAMPKPSVFVNENEKPTASVLIELLPGHQLDKSQVNAIVQLVAGSISGMKASDVTVTDQRGQLLTDKNNSEFAMSEEQLNYQKEIQDYYEKRIQTMIVPLVGVDKIEVRVFANIDFTHEEKTKEEYNPTDKAIRSEQNLTEQSSSGGGGGAPGALSNQPPESGGAAASGAGAGGGGNSRNQSIKNYDVSKSMSYTRSPQGRLQNLSVAVVVDNESAIDPKTKKTTNNPIAPEKIQKINDLVKAAIGFDEKRGDKVSVINTAFVPPQQIEIPPEPPIFRQAWFWDMMEKIGAVFITLLIAFGVIKPLLKSLINSKETVSSTEKGEGGERIVLSPEMQKLKQQQLESLKQLVNSEPTRVAGILKNWLGTKE